MPVNPFDEDPILTAEEDEPGEAVEFENQKDPAFHSFRRFRDLVLQRRQLEADLKEVTTEMARLQPQLRSYFEQNVIEGGIRVEGVTIFVRRETIVSPRDKGKEGDMRVVAALREDPELNHYVFETYSRRDLAGYVRELQKFYAADLRAGRIADISEKLSPELAAAIKIEPKVSVQGRRYSTKPAADE